MGRQVLIPVMDWATGGTLGSQAGECEGREDGGGWNQEVNTNGSAGTVTGPVQPCACVFSVIRRTPSGSKPLKPAAALLPPS